MRAAGSRTVRFDVLAEDANKRVYNIEFQLAPSGADPHRARYHLGMIDVAKLKHRQDFKILPDTCVIFITETDYFKRNEPAYYFAYCDLKTGEPLNDGTLIVYVNGAYKGGGLIGDVIHDLTCSDFRKMRNKLIAISTRYLKEEPEGLKKLNKAISKYYQEAELRNSKKIALNLLTLGKLTLKEIADMTGLSLYMVRKLKAQSQPTT